MKYYVLASLAVLMILLYGCTSAIDSLSNNTSADMIRGVKIPAGVDATSGTPVPSVCFDIGSISRKRKSDRTILIIDKNMTEVISESYDAGIEYENDGQDVK